MIPFQTIINFTVVVLLFQTALYWINDRPEGTTRDLLFFLFNLASIIAVSLYCGAWIAQHITIH